MPALLVSLIPLVLGIVMSPLAIMALVAVLVSKRARVNGVAFLIGWALAVLIVVFGSLYIFGLLELHELAELPLWVAVVRLLFAALLIAAAVWTYRRGHVHVQLMAMANSPREVVAAAPQLPGSAQHCAERRPAAVDRRDAAAEGAQRPARRSMT